MILGVSVQTVLPGNALAKEGRNAGDGLLGCLVDFVEAVQVQLLAAAVDLDGDVFSAHGLLRGD
jgi:hypothetical protein